MQPAVVHHGQPVAAHGLVQVVDGQHLGDGQAVHQVHQRQLLVDVQVIGGLVHQQDLRLLAQGAGDVDALALPARHLAPLAVLLLVHLHGPQGFLHQLVIMLGPALQGRQPGGAAQLHGIAGADGIQRVGSLRDHGHHLGDLAPAQ